VQDRELYASIIANIQQTVRIRQYRLTAHAEREREADSITIQEIEEALLSQRCEVVENYPEDPRGASCLLLGFTEQELPLHTVCGIALSDLLILVTVSGQTPPCGSIGRYAGAEKAILCISAISVEEEWSKRSSRMCTRGRGKFSSLRMSQRMYASNVGKSISAQIS
jgi:hypothetical protein